jgi:UDP-N-acetylmuramoyl-tripeptide--D-alanyl-D-alanine ligase
VLYGDDERAKEFARRAGDKKVITFGFSLSCDVRAEDFRVLFEEGREHWPIGMSARIRVRGNSAPIEIVGTLGAHTILPALAAAAVGDAVGRSLPEIVGALKAYEPPPGRMHLLEGVKNSLIIDDTYNSSPAAVVAALDALVLTAPKGRKIAVLGDMLELGRHSVEEHRKIGAHVAKTSDLLVTVGFRARDIAMGALDAGLSEENILQFEDAERAGEELEALIQSGDCVLVKGSQSVRMERTVLELMAHPERAEELLVRQDAEWRKR